MRREYDLKITIKQFFLFAGVEQADGTKVSNAIQ